MPQPTLVQGHGVGAAPGRRRLVCVNTMVCGLFVWCGIVWCHEASCGSTVRVRALFTINLRECVRNRVCVTVRSCVFQGKRIATLASPSRSKAPGRLRQRGGGDNRRRSSNDHGNHVHTHTRSCTHMRYLNKYHAHTLMVVKIECGVQWCGVVWCRCALLPGGMGCSTVLWCDVVLCSTQCSVGVRCLMW